MGHRADSAASRGPGPHRHGRLDLGRLREGSGEATRRGEVHPRSSRRRRTPPASARAPAGCRCAKRLPRLSGVPRGAVRRSSATCSSAARARPAVPIYNAISRELQLAIGYAIEGTRTPEQAVDDAFRVVSEEDARRRASVPASDGFDLLAWLPGGAGRCAWRRCARRARRAALAAVARADRRLVSIFLLYPMLELVRIAFTDLGAPGGRIATRCTDSRRLPAIRSSTG